MTHLSLHILCIIFPIYVTRRRFVLQSECSISDLCRQAVFQIKQTSLTDVLDLCAGLAYYSRLEPHACSWVPSEDGEGACAGTTRATEFLFGL